MKQKILWTNDDNLNKFLILRVYIKTLLLKTCENEQKISSLQETNKNYETTMRFQNFGESTKHAHLLFATFARWLRRASQFLQKRHDIALRGKHIKSTHFRLLHKLRVTNHSYNCITRISTQLNFRQKPFHMML